MQKLSKFELHVFSNKVVFLGAKVGLNVHFTSGSLLLESTDLSFCFGMVHLLANFHGSMHYF